MIDATCPLVTKGHQEAVRFAATGGAILLIGHRDHDRDVGRHEDPRTSRLHDLPGREQPCHGLDDEAEDEEPPQPQLDVGEVGDTAAPRHGDEERNGQHEDEPGHRPPR